MDLPKRQDQPGAVPIKQSDATPVNPDDLDDGFRKSDRGVVPVGAVMANVTIEADQNGATGKSRDRKFNGRDKPRDHRDHQGGVKKGRNSAKPKPIDPNLQFPDELTQDRGASFDQKPKSGKPKSGKPKSGQPKSGKPKFGKSHADKPKFGKAKSGKPKSGKPKFGDAKSGKPKSGQPKSNHSKSDRPKSGHAKSGHAGKPQANSKKTAGKRRFDAPAEKGLRRRAR